MKNYILVSPLLLSEQEEDKVSDKEERKARLKELADLEGRLDVASETSEGEDGYMTFKEKGEAGTRVATLRAFLGIEGEETAKSTIEKMAQGARDVAQAAEKAVGQPILAVMKGTFLARASSVLSPEQKEYVKDVIDTEEELEFYEEKYDFGREYKGVMPREEFDNILAIEKPEEFSEEKDKIIKKYKVTAPPKKTYGWQDIFDVLFEKTDTFPEVVDMLLMSKDKLNDIYREFQSEDVDPETGELTFKTEKDKQEADDLHSLIALITDTVAGVYAAANGYFMGKESAMETARLGGVEKKKRVYNLFASTPFSKGELQLKRGPVAKTGRVLWEIASTLIAPHALLGGKVLGFAGGYLSETGVPWSKWDTRKKRYTNLTTARTELKEVKTKIVNLRKAGKTAEERAKLTATIEALEADKNKLEQSIKNLEDAAKEASDGLKDSPKPNEFKNKANDAVKKAPESTKMAIIDTVNLGGGNYVSKDDLDDAAKELQRRLLTVEDANINKSSTTNRFLRLIKRRLPGKRGGGDKFFPKPLNEQETSNSASLDSQISALVAAPLAAQDEIIRDQIEIALMENYLFEAATLELSQALIKEIKDTIKVIDNVTASAGSLGGSTSPDAPATAEPQTQTPVNERKIKVSKSKLIDIISEQLKEQNEQIDIDHDELVTLVVQEAYKQVNRKK